VQYALGIADMLLLAPLWMQIVHLLFADIFWVTLLLVVAGSGTERTAPAFAKTAA
jgi:cytochrome c oxidase assembly protein subunit 15